MKYTREGLKLKCRKLAVYPVMKLLSIVHVRTHEVSNSKPTGIVLNDYYT